MNSVKYLILLNGDMLKKQQLENFCKDKRIFVPKGATKRYLESVIVRAFNHKQHIYKRSCFGWWQNENSECLLCDFKDQCFEASVGLDKKSYERKLRSSAEIIQITGSLRKKRR